MICMTHFTSLTTVNAIWHPTKPISVYVLVKAFLICVCVCDKNLKKLRFKKSYADILRYKLRDTKV
jgi:hypothetical protein